LAYLEKSISITVANSLLRLWYSWNK